MKQTSIFVEVFDFDVNFELVALFEADNHVKEVLMFRCVLKLTHWTFLYKIKKVRK